MSGLGLNLHAIVRDVIEFVHSDEDVTLYQALEQTEIDGWNIAQYAAGVTVRAQVQSTPGALMQNNALNSAEEEWTIWLYSDDVTQPNMIDAYTGRTGDMIQREDGRWYLVTAVSNDFSRVGWVCVTATLQAHGVDSSQIVSGDDEGTDDDSTDDS